MQFDTRYLINRNGTWYYQRRVPAAYRSYEPRTLMRSSLKTKSIIMAKHRRDALEIAENNYWSNLIAVQTDEISDQTLLLTNIKRQYKLDCLRALTSQPNNDFSDKGIITALFTDMMKQLGANSQPGSKHKLPPARISDAFEFYFEKVAVRDLLSKSATQKKRWYTTKRKSVLNLIEVAGDKYISELNRDDAHKIYAWWASRLVPKHGGKRLSAHSANTDIGNLRKFYKQYHAYFGLHDQPNPFRGLSFKNFPNQNKRPCFENEWVREKLLCPGALDQLHEEARCLLYLLIETGLRPSEAVHLTENDIILETDIPYLKVRPSLNRELKTPSANREIPLVGVALQALSMFPKGFPSYRGFSSKLTQYLLKSLRQHDLMPSEQHVVYSFRHSFERRMLEAGLDYGLRCRLMGHALSRPDYGGGGSMRYRQKELLKIAHPYSCEFLG